MKKCGDILVINALNNEYGVYYSDILQAELGKVQGVLRHFCFREVIFNIDAVDLGSEAIGPIIGLYKDLNIQGVRFSLMNVSSQSCQLLSQLCLDKIFRVIKKP